jgi:4-amino-4-deoxy-L-arabinose transferase-like glycosyltransferase
MENKITLLKKITQHHYLLLVILAIATFLRLYNIPNTVQFLGDQGRDALIVASMYKNLDPVFIGPVTSVGNMYLGPLYYYFMLPFLILSYPSPMGPVYALAFLGILTVFLMYFLGKRFLPKNAALWSSGLMGLSAIVAHNTRFSWNPNPAPIVALLMMYFSYKAYKDNVKYWIGVFICFAILIQLHYLTLLSGAGFGLVWLYQLNKKIKAKKSIKELMVSTGVGILIFIISLTPLILFDLKHDGINRRAFMEILTQEDAFSKPVAEDSNPVRVLIYDLKNRTELIVTDIIIGKHSHNINFFISIIVLSVLIIYLKQKHRRNQSIVGEMVVVSFLVTGILGTTLYKQNIYEHYIAYLFPTIFFTLGIAINYLLKTRLKLGYILVMILLALFAKFNYYHAKVILKSLGWTIAHTQAVAKTIEDRVQEGEKYNIVLLNSTGDVYGQNYRYFLSTSNKPPQLEENFGDVETLFIIDEERKVEREVDSPVYQIVTFPNKEPEEIYYIPNGPEIIVLRNKPN